MKTTWKQLISKALKDQGLSWKDVEACTLTRKDLNVEFDDGYGGSEGVPFTLWTKDRVFFPTTYDGAEWVGSVPRHPCEEATNHIGGE